MSTITEGRVRTRAGTRKTGGERREYRAALTAFADVVSAAADLMDVDGLLRLVAARGCEVLTIRRCAVYLRDGRDLFPGRLGHPGDEMDEGIRRLTMGGPSDAITREVVETRAPLLIRDVGADPRAARSAVRTWRVRSLLAVPMAAGDDVLGLLVFDNANEPHPYTAAHVEIAGLIGRIAGGALAQVRTAAQQRSRLDTVTRQNRLLRHAAGAEHRLSRVLLDGGGLPAIVGVLAELTGKPAVLYDAERRPVTAMAPDGGGDLPVRLLEDTEEDAVVGALLRDAVPGTCTSVGPLLQAGVRHRHLVAPVDVGDARWGWLVVPEHPSRLTAFDEFATRRAATHVALELTAQRRALTAAWDARAWLARQLIRGTQDVGDVQRNADHLGIALDVPRVVAYVTRRGGGGASADADRLVRDVCGRVGTEVLATKGPQGVALLVDVPADHAPLRAVRGVRDALAGALAGAPDLIAGVSTVCREPAMLPRGYREAREVAQCIDGFAGAAEHRVLAADDLGPGRLFVATGKAVAIGRFVEDVLGALLTGEDGTADLLRTLQSFYDTGRSVRLSSARLGVHENTVRYRLARVHALTGLDVAGDAGDQLSVQMALLVLRLQGHPALPAFDAAEAPAGVAEVQA